MKLLKENASVILLCGLAIYIMYISSNNADKAQEEVERFKIELDSLQHINDSLSDELLPTEIELGRHEVAFRIFMERNPKAAEQYATIISEETE